MMKLFNRSIWPVLFLTMILKPKELYSAPVFNIGLARTEITPTLAMIKNSTINLGGYTNGLRANGVHDSIFAQSLYLSNSKNELLVLILDTVGLGNQLIKKIKDQIVKQVPIQRDLIWIGATHSHSAPDTLGLWGGIPLSYQKYLIQRSVNVALEAYRNKISANIYLSAGHGASTNRRGWDIVDPNITILTFKAVQSQRNIGRLINFSAHPVLNEEKNKKISRDWVGALTDYTEKELGGISIFVNAILGDVSPLENNGRGFKAAELYGQLLGKNVMEALKKQVALVEDDFVIQHFAAWQSVTNPLLKLLLISGKTYNDYQIIGTEAYLKIPLNIMRLGKQVQGVSVPGESLTRQGIPIKGAMKAEYKLFFGLTEGCNGYFLSSDEWKKGRNSNYEESMSLDKKFGDKIRNWLGSMLVADNKSF